VELSAWHRWWKQRGGAHIRKVLMEEWDPIGIAGIPDAADEYDTYVGGVGQMLHEGASAEDLEEYLVNAREERMGLGPPSGEREKAAAVHLVEWYRGEMAAAEREAAST
jgi:hypothetical protein